MSLIDAKRLEPLRVSLADGMRNMLIGDVSDDDTLLSQPSGDPGLFGPDSITWRVHGDRSMFVGGLRALLLQTMHPLAMAGVAEHSDYRHDPLGRLNRTARFIGTTTFGGTEAALDAIDVVRSVHRHVNGTAPDGRHYDANDPELLRWVHSTEVASFLRAYQRYGEGPRLTAAECDRYYTEVSQIAVGLGATEVPCSVNAMRDYFTDVRSELRGDRQARETTRWLLIPPLPIAARPAYSVICAAAVAMLPQFVRRQLRVIQPPLSNQLLIQPATKTLLGALGWVMGANAAPSDTARARASA